MKKRINAGTLLIYGLAASIIVFWIAAYFTQGAVLSRILFCGRNDYFMDMFNCVHHYLRTAYLSDTMNYPPMAILVQNFFAHFIPMELRGAYDFEFDRFVIRDSQIGMMLFLIYTIVFVLLFWQLYPKLIQRGRGDTKLALIVTLLSAPMLSSLERGNIVFVAFILSLIFSIWYDSSVCWKKIVAFAALSVAAAIKIYPAILGFLLVRERRWKDTLILVCMGVAAFMLPFLWFEGGFYNLIRWINNLFSFSTSYLSLSLLSHHEITGQLAMLSRICGLDLMWLQNPLRLAFLISSLWIVIYKQDAPLWKVFALLCLNMIVLPSPSYTYILLFSLIPMGLFLAQTAGDTKSEKSDWFYALLFFILFAPCIIIYPDSLDEHTMYYLDCTIYVIENIGIYTMLIALTIEQFAGMILKKRDLH